MKRVLSVIAIIGTLALLSGCDSGVAASIGDTKISQNSVQSRVAEIQTERRKFDTSGIQLIVGEELNRSELRFLLISTIFEKLAKQYGIQITQAMKDARKAEIYNQIGGISQLPQALVNAQIAPSNFDLYVQSILISDALVAKAKAEGATDETTGSAVQKMVAQLALKEKVRVNPQYGTWDPVNADVITFDPAGTAVKTRNQ